MRSYCAIYVDVGYLLSGAATRVTGTSLRGGVVIDYQRLIDAVIAQVESDSDLPLLRLNWYDSAAGRGGVADHRQHHIGMLPRVKLRLGRLNPLGEQKGVDIRIGLDLVAHARNQAVDQMYLVTGDDDLTEAVEEAQTQGVQVILLGVPGADGQPHGVAANLQREADRMLLIDGTAIDDTVHTKRVADAPTPAPATPEPISAEPVAAAKPSPATMPPRRLGPPAPAPAPAPVAEVVYSSTGGPVSGWYDDLADDETIDDVCRRVITSWAKSATPAQSHQLRTGKPYIPGDLDRTLLVDLSERMGIFDLSEQVRFRLRERFWLAVEANL